MKRFFICAAGAASLALGGCGERTNGSENFVNDNDIQQQGLLDKALIPGVSTGADLRAWKEEGGFSADRTWMRYPIKSITTDYSGTTLTYVSAEMHSTASIRNGEVSPTFNKIKEDLKVYCGTDWKVIGSSDEGRVAENPPWSCEVVLSDDGSGPSILIFRTDHRF